MSKVSKKVREEIYYRDWNACLKCFSEVNITIDHIIPLSKGGTNHKENLQTLCKPCNEEKADRAIDYRVLSEGVEIDFFDWRQSLDQIDLKYKKKDADEEIRARCKTLALQIKWPTEKKPTTKKKLKVQLKYFPSLPDIVPHEKWSVEKWEATPESNFHYE